MANSNWRAAPAGIGRPPANLKIVAAMYSTPGMFVVRADSPYRTIDAADQGMAGAPPVTAAAPELHRGRLT